MNDPKPTAYVELFHYWHNALEHEFKAMEGPAGTIEYVCSKCARVNNDKVLSKKSV